MGDGRIVCDFSGSDAVPHFFSFLQFYRSRFGVNVAGALPFEESGAIRGLDGGFHIVLVVGLLLIC